MDAPTVATRCGIIGFEKRSVRPFRLARPTTTFRHHSSARSRRRRWPWAAPRYGRWRAARPWRLRRARLSAVSEHRRRLPCWDGPAGGRTDGRDNGRCIHGAGRFQRRRSSVRRMPFFRSVATVAGESLVAPMHSIMTNASVGRKPNKIAVVLFIHLYSPKWSKEI